MRDPRRLLALVAAFAIGLAHAARAADPVDLLLVLASDVSLSVDAAKFQLQREGYQAAITNIRVLDRIRSGRNGRIAICFVEWSGAQKVVIDWSVISGAASARRFADQLAELPRSFADHTSISGGIDFSVAQLKRAPYQSRRRTIDVSGDGTNNSGRDVTRASDEAVAQGITINGLVILTDQPSFLDPEHTHPPGGLANYYRDKVIGGPGAFVVVADNFESFGRAILHKLITEIAMMPAANNAALQLNESD
jgi:hypothetical protein